MHTTNGGLSQEAMTSSSMQHCGWGCNEIFASLICILGIGYFTYRTYLRQPSSLEGLESIIRSKASSPLIEELRAGKHPLSYTLGCLKANVTGKHPRALTFLIQEMT